MEKIKLSFKENRKRFIMMGCVLVIGIGAVVGGIIYFAFFRQSGTTGSRPDRMGEMQSDGSLVASGTTMVGMVEDSYDIDYLDDDLYIEEVSISSGDEIAEGDPILKLSEDTVTAGQKQLEKAVTKAELDYRDGVVAYHLSKVDEENTYEQSLKRGELAASVYADKLASIDQNIVLLQKQIADKQEEIQEYQNAIDNDSYYEKYDVGYKKDIFETNYAIFYERVNAWNLAQCLEYTEADPEKVQFVEDKQRDADTKEKVSQLTTFLSRVYKYQDAYEAALEEYEDAKKDAAVQLEKSKVEIASLQLQLQEAQLNYEADQNAAKTEYEMAVAEADAAERIYQTAIKKLDEALEAQQNDKEDAEDNLAHFEELVGDGYFRASSNGTALIVTSQEATDLTDGTMVMAYSNPDTVTVTVAIDQSNIAQLSIGDSATVSIADHGDYDAAITQIQPTSSSDSRSSVTYNVQVTLGGDVSDLDVNLTAVVTFSGEKDAKVQTTEDTGRTKETASLNAKEQTAADTEKMTEQALEKMEEIESEKVTGGIQE